MHEAACLSRCMNRISYKRLLRSLNFPVLAATESLHYFETFEIILRHFESKNRQFNGYTHYRSSMARVDVKIILICVIHTS